MALHKGRYATPKVSSYKQHAHMRDWMDIILKRGPLDGQIDTNVRLRSLPASCQKPARPV